MAGGQGLLSERDNAAFGAVRIASEWIGDTVRIYNQEPLGAIWSSVPAVLAHHASTSPDHPYLCERVGGEWNRKSYLDVHRSVFDLAARLATVGCSAERPLVILAGNSIRHAELALAAQYIGAPYVPVSPGYGAGPDYGRLRTMIEVIGEDVLFFVDIPRAGDVIDAVADLVRALTADPALASKAIFLDAVEPAGQDEVAARHAHVGPETIAKLLFTSGSTGKPKAVINTQRMICANQAMLRQVWPLLGARPPVLVDWLPWSHTFGANFTAGIALFNGGTYHIDGGKPTPGAIATTVENVVDARPTIYFNVPAGYEALLSALGEREDDARSFFENIDFLFCAAAALPQATREGLELLASRAVGRTIPVFSGWGSTETAPCATATWFATAVAANIGVPLPGIELKLAPDGDKLELRVKGPTVTPGYWGAPDATAAAFDHEGFYRMGDAGELIDETSPEKGILFDGRVSENFKLTTGTWVNVGTLRLSLVNLGRSIIRDIAITGHDRDEIGALVFLHQDACRQLLGAEEIDEAEISRHPAIIDAVRVIVTSHNRKSLGSSTRIGRFLLLEDAPRAERYEITDKGYLNQRAVLSGRRETVAKLYTDDAVILGC